MAEKGRFIPRPPPPKNMPEFVVTVFVLVIGTSLMIAVVGVGILILIRPDANVGPLIAVINDMMTTIIGALIGFIAGRSQGRLDEVDKQVGP